MLRTVLAIFPPSLMVNLLETALTPHHSLLSTRYYLFPSVLTTQYSLLFTIPSSPSLLEYFTLGSQVSSVEKIRRKCGSIDERCGRLIFVVKTLLGDPSKLKSPGWLLKITVEEMMDIDLNLAKRNALVIERGYRAFDYHERIFLQ